MESSSNPPANPNPADNHHDDDDKKSPASPGGEGSPEPSGDKKAGRRKIQIEFIEDKSRRHITFSKRKAGIMKKAYELSTLTGTQVLLLVASETGHVYTFATPKLQPLITKSEGKNLIQACLNAPDSTPSSAPSAASSQRLNTASAQQDMAYQQEGMGDQYEEEKHPKQENVKNFSNSGGLPLAQMQFPPNAQGYDYSSLGGYPLQLANTAGGAMRYAQGIPYGAPPGASYSGYPGTAGGYPIFANRPGGPPGTSGGPPQAPNLSQGGPPSQTSTHNK